MARGFFYVIVVLGFGAVLGLECRPETAPAPAIRVAVPIREAVAPVQADPGVAIAVILARPLFSPLRRPPAPPVADIAKLPRLSGIMVTGSSRYAIFAPQGGKPVVAAEGQSIGPYEIRRITTALVTIDGPLGTMNLHTSYPDAGSNIATAQRAMVAPRPPVILAGGITLYPATRENLPDAATWPGPKAMPGRP